MLLNSFGNEPYYNNLTKFFERFHTIKNVLDMFNGENAIESKEIFVRNNVNLFVENYGCQANENSELNKVFSSIYEQAYNVKIILNPHSDLGKLQLDNRRFEEKFDSNSNIMIDMLKTIISNQSASKMGNIATLNTDNIETTSEKVERFLEQVKSVGEDNNPIKNDEDAIAKYTKLLADVPIELRGESQVHVDKVICNIKCRIALCYSNLGNVEESFNQFKNIQPEIAKQSKLYHYSIQITPLPLTVKCSAGVCYTK